MRRQIELTLYSSLFVTGFVLFCPENKDGERESLRSATFVDRLHSLPIFTTNFSKTHRNCIFTSPDSFKLLPLKMFRT